MSPIDPDVLERELLLCLSPLLGAISVELENYSEIGESRDWIGKGPPPEFTDLTAESAIKNIRNLRRDIWRCEILASFLLDSELKRDVLTTACGCLESIGHVDQPAEVYPARAVTMCENAVERAYQRWGEEVHLLSVKCSVELKCKGGISPQRVSWFHGLNSGLWKIDTDDLESVINQLKSNGHHVIQDGKIVEVSPSIGTQKTYPSSELFERDGWIFLQWKAGKTYENIISDLRKEKNFNPVESVSGLRAILDRYAAFMGLPRPRKEPGRPKKKA